ncbi:MAG: cell wall hydrolase [Chloroflexota bacterium]
MRMTRLADIRRVFATTLPTLTKKIAVLGGHARKAGGKRIIAAALAAALVLTTGIGAVISVRHNRAATRLALQQQAVAADPAAQAQAQTPAPSERDRQATVSRGAARPPVRSNDGSPPGYTWDEVMLLAHLIYAEANLEPYSGQVAVGAVVLNRTRSGEFPSTIAGVIYQPGQYESVGNYYFNSDPGQTAINAALDAMRGWDPSNGAIYFFDPAKVTNKFLWARPLTVTIGGHRFTK